VKRRVCLCIAVLFVLLNAGCRRETPAAGNDAERGRNAVTDVITQRHAVEAGHKAKATLEKVQARRKQDFEEALGEQK